MADDETLKNPASKGGPEICVTDHVDQSSFEIKIMVNLKFQVPVALHSIRFVLGWFDRSLCTHPPLFLDSYTCFRC